MSVPHVLLALLAEGPKYGLQLREEFETGTGEVWPLNVGQVYKTRAGLNGTGWPSPTALGRTDRRSGSGSRRAGRRRWPTGCARRRT